MQVKRLLVLALMLGILLFPGQASAALYDEIQESLICPACLDDRMTVAACNDSTAEQTRQDIQQKLASGQTKDQIIEAYVTQYGETILTVPRTTGFNLIAWIVPPLGLIGGIAIVYYAVTRWVRNRNEGPPEKDGQQLIDSVDEERLNEEMIKYL